MSGANDRIKFPTGHTDDTGDKDHWPEPEFWGSRPALPKSPRKAPEEKPKEEPKAEEAAEEKVAPEYAVTCFGDFNKKLLSTNYLRFLAINDGMGKLAAMIIRMDNGLWGFAARGEPDWEEVVRSKNITNLDHPTA